MPVADEYPLCSDDEVEMEEDDNFCDYVTGLFGVNLGDASVSNDADDGGGVAASTDTHGTSSHGKRTSSYWNDFEEIKENDIRVAAICKMCGKRYTTRSAIGTGHLLRHQKACRKNMIMIVGYSLGLL
jgi:hypothetical protein